MTKHSATITKLLKKYHLQPLIHKRILQIIALLFHVQRKTDIIECINKSGLLIITKDKKIHHQNSIYILNQLVKQGLLQQDYNCRSKLIHPLTRIAVSDHNPDAKANLDIINTFDDQEEIPKLFIEMDNIDHEKNIGTINI